LSHKSNKGLVSHLDHPLKVPIWIQVVCENAEIVILGIDVCFFGIQDNLGTEIAINTIAEHADLIKESIL